MFMHLVWLPLFLAYTCSLNIFYRQFLYSNGVGSQVLTTLVTTLPLTRVVLAYTCICVMHIYVSCWVNCNIFSSYLLVFKCGFIIIIQHIRGISQSVEVCYNTRLCTSSSMIFSGCVYIHVGSLL